MKYRIAICLLVITLPLFGMENPAYTVTPLEQKLFDAIKNHDIASVKDCINQRVNVNIKDFRNQTPLSLALYFADYEIALLLLQQKNIETNGNYAVMGSKNSFRSNLHQIFSNTDDFIPLQTITLLKLLLEKGANPDVVDSNGNTPLHKVIQSNTASQLGEAVELLVDAGAAMIFEPKSLKTPLQLAIAHFSSGHVPPLLKSHKLSLPDLYNNINWAGWHYKEQLKCLIKKFDQYKQYFLVSTLSVHPLNLASELYDIVEAVTAQYRHTVKLKKLNECYGHLKKLAATVRTYAQQHACPTADHTMIDEIDVALTAVVSAQEIHTSLCRYYRAMRLMEHAKPKQELQELFGLTEEKFRLNYDTWQSSQDFRLPIELKKMIAYQVAKN